MDKGGKDMRINVMRTAYLQNGFSLLELLIAVSLLSIGLFAVVSMQATAIGSNGIANQHTSLASLAQEVMEDILSWKGDDSRLSVAASNSAYDLDPGAAGPSLTIPGSGTYNATYSITPDAPVNGNPIPGLTRIEVTVKGGNNGKSLTFICYKRLL